jgi:Flp pilus assembly protein TadD
MKRRLAMKTKALQLLKSNPADIRANYELARLQIQESDFKAAEETLKKAVQTYEKQSAQKRKNFKGWLLYE